MEYTIHKISKMANISTRTLRYYDEIGLLKPARVNSSGYRIYGENEINILQQIMFFKELGVSLDNIHQILHSPDYDHEKVLKDHLNALLDRRASIDLLINNVTKTITSLKGGESMTDAEKFEGFKKKLIDNNEEMYGEEIREKYGKEIVEQSNSKIKNMTPEQYKEIEKLSTEVNEAIIKAFESGNPESELAIKACELHKNWLTYFYPNYCKEYHMSLGQMYVEDERFKAYYDKLAEGCSEFLRDAINYYCSLKK